MPEEESQLRRGVPRYELGQDLKGHTRQETDIQLVDLSTSGALIEHYRFLKPGTELRLKIPLGDKSVKVEAVVVHSSFHRMQKVVGRPERTIYRAGVAFDQVPESGRQAIQKLIIERLENDRREQPRLYFGSSARLEEEIELIAINLGARGGLFSVKTPLEFNSEQDFVFQLPGARIRLRGVVRHCQAWAQAEKAPIFQIGVEFLQFYDDGNALIEEYLSRLDGADSV